MIECVNLETNHLFNDNPICAQHRLRYKSIIVRQGWDVPTVRDLEFDSYDNPAAYYLVKRNAAGEAIGTSRLYPTSRPYMLQQAFAHLVNKSLMPCDDAIWEGSRFCIDQSLPQDERKRVMQEIVVGYLEFALMHNIRGIVGIMYPIYWKNIFIRSGWNVEWLGDVHHSDEGHKIIAGHLPVLQEVLDNVRKVTGIYEPVLSMSGTLPITKVAA